MTLSHRHVPTAAPVLPLGQPAVAVRRLQRWEDRLEYFLDCRVYRPFRWGTNDCAAFAADAVQAMTGRDVLAELRVPRTTALEAMRAARRIGGVPAALERAGLEPIDPRDAHMGDLVMVRDPATQDADPVLAVVTGNAAVCPGPRGAVVAPLSWGVAAWRVG